MYNLVERRPIWFTLSILLILPGIIFMIWSSSTTGSALPLSIDYTGGTLWEMRFETDHAGQISKHRHPRKRDAGQ